MRARLKRDVDGALPEQPSVGLGDRGDCVDLGVCVTPLAVETFAMMRPSATTTAPTIGLGDTRPNPFLPAEARGSYMFRQYS